MPQTPTDSLAASPGDIGTVEDIVLESATPTPSRNQLDDLRGIASDRGGPQPEEIEDAIDTIGNPPVVDGNNPPSPQQEAQDDIPGPFRPSPRDALFLFGSAFFVATSMHLMLFHDFLRLVVAGQHSANDNAVDDVAIDDQFDDIGIVDDEGVDADNDSAPPGCGGGPASSCSASSATRRTSSFGSMA